MKKTLTFLASAGFLAGSLMITGCGEETAVKEETKVTTPGGETKVTTEKKVETSGDNPPAVEEVKPATP